MATQQPPTASGAPGESAIHRAYRKFFKFIMRHSVVVLVLTLLSTIGWGIAATKIGFDFSPDQLFVSNDPALDFYLENKKKFRTNDSLIIFAIEPDDLFTESSLKLLQEVTKEIAAFEHIVEVESLVDAEVITPSDNGFSVEPLFDELPASPAAYAALKARALDQPLLLGRVLSPDGKAAAVVARVSEELATEGSRRPLIAKFEALQARTQKEHPELKAAWAAGVTITEKVIVSMLQGDQMTFIPLAALMMLVILAFVFRHYVGVIVPMAVIFVTMVWTVGLMAATGERVNILNNVVFTLILVYGIGDSIHILARYREELAKGVEKNLAIEHALTDLGVACFLTSFTTAIGFLSLETASMDMIKRMGLYASFGIMMAYVSSIMLIPALLIHLPKFPVKQVKEEAKHAYWLDAQLHKMADLVIARPYAMLIGGAFLVILGVTGATRLKVESRLNEEIDPNHPIQQATHFAEEKLAGVLPFDVIVQCQEVDCIKNPAVLKAMDTLQSRLEEEKQTITVSYSMADLVKEMNRAMFIEEDSATNSMRAIPATREAVSQYMLLYESSVSDTTQLRDLVNADYNEARIAIMKKDTGTVDFFRILDGVQPLVDAFPDGVKATITGPAFIGARGVHNIVWDMGSSLASSFILISLTMMLLVRSFKVGGLSMIPNIVPVIFGLGLMGYFDISIRIATVVIFSVALGIAVDNSIHVLARFQSELDDGKGYEEALHATLVTTGRAIIFSAAILFLGISVVSVSNFIAMRHFAVLTNVVLATAVIGSLAILPALLMIFRPMQARKRP